MRRPVSAVRRSCGVIDSAILSTALFAIYTYRNMIQRACIKYAPWRARALLAAAVRGAAPVLRSSRRNARHGPALRRPAMQVAMRRFVPRAFLAPSAEAARMQSCPRVT